jgi:hypothetical protein
LVITLAVATSLAWAGYLSRGCCAEKSAAAASTPKETTTTGDSKKISDPIERNGKHFEGWPTPKLVIFATGGLAGYMEPCGCAGIEFQTGGLARRYSMLQELRDKNWPVIAVDAGGMISGKRGKPQAEIQMEMCAKAYQQMGYKAIGLGGPEMRIDDFKLLQIASDFPIFLTGNFQLMDKEYRWKFKVENVGPYKIFVTYVLGTGETAEALGADYVFVPPAEALAEIVKLPEFAECNVHILLGYMHRESKDPGKDTLAKLLADRRFADKFDLAVAALDDLNMDPAFKVGKTLVVNGDVEGKKGVAVGFFDDKANPIRVQKVTIDSRYPDAKAMLDIKEEYQENVKRQYKLWMASGFKGGLTLPMPAHPKADTMGKFVGVKQCVECHTEQFKIWEKTGHAQATETLISRTKPPRTFDPECIACHMTGWDPEDERFVPFKSGFASVDTTPHLLGNQCENCHGPGEKHVAAENAAKKLADAATIKVRDSQRKLVHVELEEKACLKCHDGENSPDFKLDPYWEKIAH